MRSESWLRLMSGLILVGVFAAGTLFGAGLMRLHAPAVAPVDGPMMGRPRGGPVEVMRRELSLDAEQDRKLQEIVGAHRGELDSIGRSAQETVRRIMFAIEDELRPHLSAEQVQRLETWRTRRPPMGPPGMGPPGMGPSGMGPPGMGPPPGR